MAVSDFLLFYLCVCVGLITSAPGGGGGLQHVDHVIVTLTKVLTRTVTRPVDTVIAR